MRWIVAVSLLCGMGIAAGMLACTANVSGYRQSVASRVDQACSELGDLCTKSGRGCSQQRTLCSAVRADLVAFFTTEDTCKNGCGVDVGCLRQCKATRIASMTNLFVTRDLDGDGQVGDAATTCTDLSTLCTTAPEACPANEFFCTPTTQAASDYCSQQLLACKAACPARDRVCRGACRDQYRECVAGGGSGGGTPDAGVPDSPMTTTYDLTVTTNGTGSGSIARNPAGTSCGTTCGTYAAGTLVTLTATPATGSTFTGWTGCTSATNTCTVTVSQAMTVTATFTPATTTTYNLTTTTTGTGSGSVTRNPAGTSCGTSCGTYAAGTMVTLTATPATGSTFTSWTGCTSTTNTCTVTVNQAMSVTAAFTLAPPSTYNLTYATNGTGTGTIALDPAGTSCGTGCATYAAGTSVSLSATPGTSSAFTGWSGSCTGTGACTVAMTANRSVTASFDLTCLAAAALPTPSDGHHNAGTECLSCHSNAAIVGSTRVWTVAGTVYNSTSGAAAVSQGTIEVVDAAGKTVQMSTATNGNFWTTQAVTFPLHVRASKCPYDVTMSSSASAGSCNGCHGSTFRVHLP